MAFLTIAAAIAAFVPPLAETPAPLRPAKPALWVVADADTTIYLFGTFHALDGQSDWFSDQVESAFARSDQLVLETIIPGSAVPVVKAKALGAAGTVGPIARIAGSASFLSSTKMVMSAGRSNGMSTAQGADVILSDAALAAGKPVGGLESFEFQLDMFSKLPPAPRARGAAETAATMNSVSSVLADLQAAWNRGDAERFAPMLEQMRTKSPDMYRMMFVDRNARWAAWIARRLEQPGTVFVAVGAGHFAGRDSVRAKLTTLGLGTARLN
ncbi:MAG TPA: TraB/GumN family protein [Sphingomicrobium sp.]|nr:TraB/GumN family protein [Sphingomicrobium sp.]